VFCCPVADYAEASALLQESSLSGSAQANDVLQIISKRLPKVKDDLLLEGLCGVLLDHATLLTYAHLH
jgi:hypothetical protein